jgi:hypothetical protein
MAFTGATPPNVPNYTKTSYLEPFGDLDASGNWTGTSLAPGDRKNPNPPPYFDSAAGGVAGVGPGGTLPAFKTNTAALASGTSTTSGGTEGSYPGTGTAPFNANMTGAVPASTSVAHEAAGTEVVVQKIVGSTALDYSTAVGLPYVGVGGGIAGPTGCWQMVTMSCGPTLTATLADPTKIISPNALHASYDTVVPTSAPTITGLLPLTPVSSSVANTTTLTVNGTNFRNGAVVNIAGVPYPTQYNSATQLKVMNAPMKTSAGNTAITVRVGGTTTASTNWVFS